MQESSADEIQLFVLNFEKIPNQETP